MNIIFLAIVLAIGAPLSSGDWPEWRGVNGTGVARSLDAPLVWSRDQNIKWRVSLDLPANGSPVVAGDGVFLTMPEDPEGKQRSLYCFDRATGQKRWVRTVDLGRVMPTHRTNPYGGSTPATDGEKVVVWHASAGLHCYRVDGEPLWQRDLGEFRHRWGYGTSPVLHDGKVILHTGPGVQPFVAAFDLATGETLWKTIEPEHRSAQDMADDRIAGSWCTPLVLRSGGRTVVLCGHPTRVVAYDLADGSIIWTCDGVAGTRGDLTYSSPVVADDVCVFVGGWQGPTLGVRLGGAGNVTETHRLWRHEGQMSNCASGVFANGFVYVPDMNGMLWCIDPATGVPAWRKRIGRGATWGSIVLAGDRMYLTNQSGTTMVFTADAEELRVLARNELDEDTNSTPAIAGGEIFLRTHEHLYCIAEDDAP